VTTCMFLDCSRNGLFLRPSSFEARGDSARRAPKTLGPLAMSKRYTVERNASILTCVVSLFFASRPSTVFRGVRTVIIDAVKRFVFWPSSHIGKEVSKRFSPSRAHIYSTLPIGTKPFIRRVVASRNHCFPYLVFGRARHAVGDGVMFSGGFLQASARSAYSVHQRRTANRTQSPAGALTRPIRYALNGFCAMKRGPSTEGLTSKVNEVRHFRHLEKFTMKRVWQAVVKPLFGSYPSHGAYYTGVAA